MGRGSLKPGYVSQTFVFHYRCKPLPFFHFVECRFLFFLTEMPPKHNKTTYVKCSGLSVSLFYLFPLLSTGYLQGVLLLFVNFWESVFSFCFFFWGGVFSFRCWGPDFNVEISYFLWSISNWRGLKKKKFPILLSPLLQWKSRSWADQKNSLVKRKEQRKCKWTCLNVIWLSTHFKEWSSC